MNKADFFVKNDISVSALVNPFFGRRHIATKPDTDFKYKDVSRYELQEWIDNIFIAPSENSSFLDHFYFIDKRSLYNYSLMGVSMRHEDIHLLKDDQEACRCLMLNYFNKPYS